MDAMIDLETMGTTSNCAIVSIGVVLFDPRKGVLKGGTFYSELDWKNQGRKIDKSCYYEFWKKQPKQVRKQLKGEENLEDALIRLSEFLPKGVKVWGNGPTFDISFLEHAYDSLLLDVPWKFWNIRDCRTILDMYKSKRGEIGYYGFADENNHNALDDAINQARKVCEMWTELLSPEDDIPF